MEVVLVVLRPKGNLAGQDYRHRLYEVLLLDSKTPPTETARPGKYLPMFSTESMEEEPWEQVLTEVLKITGGIKGAVCIVTVCSLSCVVGFFLGGRHNLE